MTAQTPTILKTYFMQGDKPTQSQFADLIDSYINTTTPTAQTIASSLTITGNAIVSGNASVNGTLNVTGNAIVSGNSTVTGTLAAGATTVPSLNLGGSTLSTYVTGSWTPTDASGAGLSLSVTKAIYTQIGNIIYYMVYLTYPATADATGAKIGGLPVAAGTNDFGTAIITSGYTGSPIIASVRPSTTTFQIENATNEGAITNANLSGKYVIVTGFYFTN